MNAKKYKLMAAEETAQILGISLDRLYEICEFFDSRSDDQWDLLEGEHFEWLSQSYRTRRFYEEGAMAIAKYLQETATSGFFSNLLDTVLEKLTHRRKKVRQLLVRRRVILELQSLEGVIVHNDLVFIERPKVIRLLDTNGKGLNAAAKREQKNSSLQGREPMQMGVHFNTFESVEHWSQRGLARIAQNMSENLAQKSRKAWTEAVAEVVEDAIEEQKKYLESFDARVQKAVNQAKAAANKKCQVTLKNQGPTATFNLHAHHLFDRSTRPDLAARLENLLVMQDELHQGFHKWYGSGSCEPKHFVDYLTSVEAWRFESSQMTSHLHRLINRLEKLQKDFENRYCVP